MGSNRSGWISAQRAACGAVVAWACARKSTSEMLANAGRGTRAVAGVAIEELLERGHVGGALGLGDGGDGDLGVGGGGAARMSSALQ